MPLDTIIHHWSDFFWGGADAAHEGIVDHSNATLSVPIQHGPAPLDHHHMEVYSSFLSRPRSAASTVSAQQQHTAFLEVPFPFPRLRARARAKLQFWQEAAHDFQRTRLFHKGKFYSKQHLRKWGLVEAFGIGALLGGAGLYHAPLPDPTPKPKSKKEAAVVAFQAKRTQASSGQLTRYESMTVHPKLPGDRFKCPPSNASVSTRSGSSSAPSAECGRNKRWAPRRGQPAMPDDDNIDSDAEDMEASSSA